MDCRDVVTKEADQDHVKSRVNEIVLEDKGGQRILFEMTKEFALTS